MAETSERAGERFIRERLDGMVTRKCPICEGWIRATREEFLDKLVLSADCEHVELDGGGIEFRGDGFWFGLGEYLYGETTIYCENGHTHEEMIEAARVTAEEN